jgi:hypothetical protein
VPLQVKSAVNRGSDSTHSHFRQDRKEIESSRGYELGSSSAFDDRLGGSVGREELCQALPVSDSSTSKICNVLLNRAYTLNTRTESEPPV